MTLQLSTDVEGGYPLDLPSSVEKKDIEGGFPLELSSPAEKKEVEQEGVKKVEKPYSKDCFSLLLIEGGGNGRCLYLFGFFVPLLQIAIFMMFLIYASAASAVETVVDEYRAEWPRLSDNLWRHTHAAGYEDQFDVPEGEEISIDWFRTEIDFGVRISRFLAMTVYILIPEAGLADLVKAIHYRRTATFHDVFVSIFRLFHACIAVFTVAVLIMTAGQSVDVFLNFAALNFACEFDEKAFQKAKEGLFGQGLKQQAETIADSETTLDEAEENEKRRAQYIAMTAVGIFFAIVFAMDFTDYTITSLLGTAFASGHVGATFVDYST